MSYALWFVQVMLAIVFLSAGGVKLVLPIDALGMPFQLPVVFVRFIGLCEVLGALGLILPGLLRVRTELTSLAALGLTAIMPIGVGLLAACVAYARWRVAPLHKTSPLGAPAEAQYEA